MVKRFLKEPGGVDQYKAVTIQWIRHHNPDLTIYNDDHTSTTIDLSGYSYQQLHKLFREQFSPSAPSEHASTPQRAERQPSTRSSAPLQNDASLPHPDTNLGRQPAEGHAELPETDTMQALDVLQKQHLAKVSLGLVGSVVAVLLLIRCAIRYSEKQAARMKAMKADDAEPV